MAKILQSLYNTVESHKNIEEVHFTADGHHHFRAFQHGKDMYTRLEEVPEKTSQGVHTGKHILQPIADASGKPHPAHKIVETLSREQVLKSTPVPDPEIVPAKNDALAQLNITPEEYEAFMKSRKAKK